MFYSRINLEEFIKDFQLFLFLLDELPSWTILLLTFSAIKIIANISCYNVFPGSVHSSGMCMLINKHEMYLIKY